MSDEPVAPQRNDQEVQQIDVSVEVEQLDAHLFRSKALYLPFRARGVFGGQVISQALSSASRCVKPEYLTHSLHCYFLLGATTSEPILYYVDIVRDGRSYCTRAVRAVQHGRTVFIMLCSFQIPEPENPIQYQSMPNVLSPEKSPSEEEFVLALAKRPGMSEASKKWYIGHAEQRTRSPVEVRLPGSQTSPTGRPVFMYWMRTREDNNWDGPAQKCILAYISDLHFINAAVMTAGLRWTANGEKQLAMSSTIDHTISFYNDDFRCSEWILYVVDSPVAGSGRGYSRGMMYSQKGTLLAVMTQEGVVRREKTDRTRL